jgi:single-strand DNA-binding protein
MARSVNKVILVGNLGKDPELRSTPQGKSVCSFSIATSESYLDKVSNEWKENTDWHNIVLWERLADSAARSLKKGSKVYIEGSLKHRSYEGKDGVTRYVTEVLGRELVLLDKVEGGGSGGQNNYPQARTYENAPSKSYDAPETSDFSNQADDDDEVPF